MSQVLIDDMSAGGKLDFGTINRELAKVEKLISENEEKWETCALELEELKEENDRINNEVGR